MPVRLTTEQFVERANGVHKHKYTYTKTDYKGTYSPIIITCTSTRKPFERFGLP